eukprot:COSAG04_NODE_20_length_39202_cov_9.993530_19_plen_68_part_00
MVFSQPAMGRQSLMSPSTGLIAQGVPDAAVKICLSCAQHTPGPLRDRYVARCYVFKVRTRAAMDLTT